MDAVYESVKEGDLPGGDKLEDWEAKNPPKKKRAAKKKTAKKKV